MDGLEKEFLKLKEIIQTLRSPDKGCPWDKKQTFKDVIKYLKEETEELEEAILKEDIPGFREELGDVFLELVFLSEMAEEKNYFLLEETLREINEKLIRRHPHIFSKKENITAEEVEVNWEKIKSEEKSLSKHFIKTTVYLNDVFKRTEVVQRKASAVGFDWTNPLDVIDKLQEELEELKVEIKAKKAPDKAEKVKSELGDVIFSAINLARFLSIPLDEALSESLEKFISRFKAMENNLKRKGEKIEALSFSEMDSLWEKVKKQKR
jgi:MazG family protein